jgi:hypothetical protein
MCLAAMALVGCMGAEGVDDPADASFLSEGKGDAFGIEDWSPDGAAVLKLVSTASESKLRDDVGLSQRAVDGILAQRTAIGGTFDDLRQLDDAKYIGTTSFKRLLTYVTEHKLFKTALRIPLVLDDGGSGITKPLTDYNQLAHAFGKTGFAKYTFIDGTVPYGDKATSYEMRLADLAAAAGVTIDGEMMRYASQLADYGDVCYVGNGADVPELAQGQSDDLMGDMYSLWAWRFGTEEWMYDDTYDPADEFGAYWTNYDTTSDTVLMFTSNNDDGDASSEDVPPCR